MAKYFAGVCRLHFIVNHRRSISLVSASNQVSDGGVLLR
jgi:hypothetical protein